MKPLPATRPRRPARASTAGRWPAQALIGAVHGYRLLLKPWIGNACRFEPTCSAYALEALAVHGAARGSALSAARLLRCHPWCAGGVDPVPPAGATGRALWSRAARDALSPTAPAPSGRAASGNPP